MLSQYYQNNRTDQRLCKFSYDTNIVAFYDNKNADAFFSMILEIQNKGGRVKYVISATETNLHAVKWIFVKKSRFCPFTQGTANFLSPEAIRKLSLWKTLLKCYTRLTLCNHNKKPIVPRVYNTSKNLTVWFILMTLQCLHHFLYVKQTPRAFLWKFYYYFSILPAEIDW